MAKKKNGKSKKIDPKVKATILSKLTLLGGFKDPIITTPHLKYNLRLEEKKNNVAVISFGRMNPPTIGHQKLVDKVKETARSRSGKPMIFLSHTQDSKKNPLGYNDKIRLARTAFGRDVIKPSRSKTIIQIAQELEGKYDDLVMVVGEDRVREFTSLLNKYNGKDYSFNNIEVISAGTRDPDSSDVSGMSASKMRGFVSSGDEDSFRKGLPFALQRQSNRVFDLVSKNLSESKVPSSDTSSIKAVRGGEAASKSLVQSRRMKLSGSSKASRDPKRGVMSGPETTFRAQVMALTDAQMTPIKNTYMPLSPDHVTDATAYYLAMNPALDPAAVNQAGNSKFNKYYSYLKKTQQPGVLSLNKDTGYRDA